MWDGFAAPENEPVLTRVIGRGAAAASTRSPETVGLAHAGVVTHNSLFPIEPSAPTRSGVTVYVPSRSTPAQRRPLPYHVTSAGWPGGRFPFGYVTGHDDVVRSRSRAECWTTIRPPRRQEASS